MKRDLIQALCSRLRSGRVPMDDATAAAKLLEDAYLGTGTSEVAYKLQVENEKMRETLRSVTQELRTLRVILDDAPL